MSQQNKPGCLNRLRDQAWAGIGAIAAIIGTIVAILALVITYWGPISTILAGSPPPGSCAAGDKPGPTLPSSAIVVEEQNIQIPANILWKDTGITVQKGDWIEFTANGSWWNGISATNPDGDCGLEPSACGECPVIGGNLGELIGKVGDGLPFRIGSSALQAIDQGGDLLLAMNDNAGICTGGRIGSCYDDNRGALEVKVTIRRIK